MPDLLTELGLAHNSYFYHRTRLQIADKYAEARQTIADIFELNHRRYGYRCPDTADSGYRGDHE
jgi:hypothetical protein